MPRNTKKAEASPTKTAEARAKKNADLSTANTDVKTAKGGEQERPEIPVNFRPEDRIR